MGRACGLRFGCCPRTIAMGHGGSGEIDILEAVNLGVDGRNDIHGTIHFGGPCRTICRPDRLISSVPLSWINSTLTRSSGICWSCGGMWTVSNMQADSMAHPGSAYPALRPAFYILLNLAVVVIGLTTIVCDGISAPNDGRLCSGLFGRLRQ